MAKLPPTCVNTESVVGHSWLPPPQASSRGVLRRPTRPLCHLGTRVKSLDKYLVISSDLLVPCISSWRVFLSTEVHEEREINEKKVRDFELSLRHVVPIKIETPPTCRLNRIWLVRITCRQGTRQAPDPPPRCWGRYSQQSHPTVAYIQSKVTAMTPPSKTACH